MLGTAVVRLDDLQWQVLLALKREFTVEEIGPSPWTRRAAEAGVPLETFFKVAEGLSAMKVIGRFSTFLEHVKPSLSGVRVTRFNALFHWAVPAGREIEAGGEVGRPPHSDPLLLAGSRPGFQQRQHHGPWRTERKRAAC